ncbi:MAG: recombination mediator RecR [Bacteroidaceae bacterium]|nr:recombination mediator RecR [Bacteroidaceae bacterium]MCI6372262.1 recombination mediator RecR [Paraprevotella sp.]MCI6744422.1 recombination mediator RecR [Paraprevotella sp.]MDD7242579.1 recombination mediator RecR [Paraprevotella sp.]MDY2715790.1 recombination mediator RecR [Bacteroidaceae bacterium]
MTSDSQYPSMLLQRAVTEISKLPGIGQKTALRLALHLLRQETEEVDRMAQSIMDLRHGVRKCRVCRNICDGDTCTICANPARDPSLICVVENVQDVMAVERTLQYRGLYHVLGGVISPMDGIGPANLEIESLVERVSHGDICEVILALSPTMEGDTTGFYIYRKLQHTQVPVSTLARGVAQNEELQYTDEATLGRAISARVPFTR